MRRVYLNVDDVLTIAIMNDRYLVSYEELETNCDLLNQLYENLQGIQLDEAYVILHGVFSTSDDGDMAIPGGSVFHSNIDIEAISKVLCALNIKTFSFFEALGLTVFMNKGPTVYLVPKKSSVDIVVLQDHTVAKAQYDIYDNVRGTVLGICNQLEITSVKVITEQYYDALLKYFCNLDKLGTYLESKRVKHILTLFAFTMTKNCDSFKIDRSKVINVSEKTDSKSMYGKVQEKSAEIGSNFGLDASTQKPTNAVNVSKEVQETEKQEGVQEESVRTHENGTQTTQSGEVQTPEFGDIVGSTPEVSEIADTKEEKSNQPKKLEEKPKPVKKAEKKQKVSKKIGLPFALVWLIIFLSVAASIGSFIAESVTTKTAILSAETNGQLQTDFATRNAQLEAYKRIGDVDVSTDNVQTFSCLDFTKFSQRASFHFNRETINITDTYAKKEDALTLENSLKSTGKVSSSSVRKSGKIWICSAVIKM